MASLAALPTNLQPLRCAWLGPTSGGLAWLFQRLRTPIPYPAPLALDHYPQIEIAQLRRLAQRGGLDRIILACSTRLEFPRDAIEFLQRDCPDVPLAIACDSWWDGSRRTGLGTIDTLTLPWYRWWDGWTPWLEGRQPDMFGPCQPSVAPWAQAAFWPAFHRHEGVDGSPIFAAQECPPARGIVVGNCRQTCEASLWLGQVSGFEMCFSSWQKFQQQLAIREVGSGPQWILWDDSCISTGGPRSAYDPSMENFFKDARQALPRAWLIAALSLPRADQWLRSSLGRRQELIVKPDSGQALTRLLMHVRSTAAAPQPR